MAAKARYVLGVKCLLAPPTKKHHAAVWECMLGTVYAMNQDGAVRYFDYDQAAAVKFANLIEPRLYRVTERLCHRTGAQENTPRVGKLVLWSK